MSEAEKLVIFVLIQKLMWYTEISFNIANQNKTMKRIEFNKRKIKSKKQIVFWMYLAFLCVLKKKKRKYPTKIYP